MKRKLANEIIESDNTNKRYKKELDITREYAITKFAKEIIDVSDNMERALEYIQKIKIGEENEVE